MKLEDFKKEVPQPLREVSLVFPEKESELLLAMKKRGFGEGHWNGTGGKPENGESIEECAIRETQEEIGVTAKNLREVATLDFYFPHQPLDKEWNQRVIVYFTSDWDGQPTETEEMRPKCHKKDNLPFDIMWPDDKHWLPKVLAGEYVRAEFAFAEDGSIQDMSIN